MEDVEGSRLKSECKISLNETETDMVNYPQLPNTDQDVKINNYNSTNYHNEQENESGCIVNDENERKRKGSPHGDDFLGFKKRCIEEASEYYRKYLKYSTLNFSFDDIKSEFDDGHEDVVNGTSEKHIPIESLEITREQSSVSNKDVHGDVDHNVSQGLNSTKSEYAQYLGLQPTVKFKCIKCSTSNFPTLTALNRHFEKCSEQIHGPDTSKPSGSTDVPSTSSSSSTNFKITRRVYLCSACGVYFEIWKLFLHMRTAHRRYICLICLGLFSVAEKLSNHLVIKHNVVAKNYDSVQTFFRDYTGQIFVMCCTCEKMFTEKDNFAEHICDVNNKDLTKSNNLINSSYSNVATNSINQQTVQLSESVSTAQTLKSSSKKLTNKLNSKLKNKILPSEHVTADSTLDTTNQISDAKEISSNETNSIETPHTTNIDTVHTTNPESHGTDQETVSEKSSKPTDNTESEKTSNTNTDKQKNTDIVENTQENAITEQINTQESKTCSNESSHEHETAEQRLHSPSLSVIEQEKSDKIEIDDKTSVKSEEINENSDTEMIKSVEESNSIEKPNSDIISDTSKEVMPSQQVCDEQRRVPKVTLKLPPITKNLPIESESDSDDSLKLTMEVDDNASMTHENKMDMSNTTDEAPMDTKENLNNDISNNVDEVKKENFVDGFPVADSNIPIVELGLRPPLDKVTIQSLLKDFIRATCFTCVYCNYARKIAVNGKQLGLHMIAEHRYSATADSITGEELLPETFVKRIKEDLEPLQTMYFNLESYDNQDPEAMIPYDRTYECFQCRFVTTVHKELYLHNRKMHQKTLLLCVMCKSTFYSYSELLCHLCPGVYLGTDVMFRCCLCPIDNLPSAFRLMVHLRKRHHACDVCLETCSNQAKLSNHVWKHKLHHLCYRCGIAYRNKPDITKHLFWKHGTESVLCKKCIQKKWPHVYHFCIPPLNFTCDECNKSFTRAVALKVHKRLHSNIKPYSCSEENCSEQFISKKLLEKHTLAHRDPSILNPVINAPTLESEPDVVEVEAKETKSADEECPKIVEYKDEEIEKETPAELKTKPVVDVYDLPALNLSESDSDSDDESPPVSAPTETKLNDEIMRRNEIEEIEMEDTKPIPIVDGIWDNFKNYQAAVEKRELGTEFNKDLLTPTETKTELEGKEPYQDNTEQVELLIQAIQKDHDYCQSEEKHDTEADKDKVDHDYCFGNENKTTAKEEPRDDNSGNESKNKNNSDSSSDSDSSSCSCGSNCSCSSSTSGSSSSSSSSSDSDSSSSEGRRKNSERRQKRKEKIKNKKKTNEISVDDVVPQEQQPVQNVPVPLVIDLPIYESDLYTDESETDEDFYDECPQLLAKKLIEEKKNQLLLDVGGPPSINGSMFETSRSSTPNIPEEQPVIKKKQKIKSKKRKKTSKSKSPVQSQEVMPLKLNIPHSYFAQQALHNNIYSPNTSITSVTVGPSVQSPKLLASVTPQPQPQIIPSTPTPIPSTTFNSNAGSGSETDSNLRLSKRRRVPNKFYGYSSDEDSSSRIAKQPPPEPPQLQWNKEDLPSPPRITTTIETPYVSTLWNKTTVSQITPQNVQAPPSSSDSSESDADSDDERLHISQPNYSAPSTTPTVVPPVSTVSVTTPLQSIVPRPTENLYCYCQCPYDEVSEMIACDGKKCAIEWFHFECVGIMVPPKGKWFCPDCRKQNSQRPEYFASQ